LTVSVPMTGSVPGLGASLNVAHQACWIVSPVSQAPKSRHYPAEGRLVARVVRGREPRRPNAGAVNLSLLLNRRLGVVAARVGAMMTPCGDPSPSSHA
jgi:hypothetical protein